VAEDADAIAGIHIRAWQAAYRGLVPDSYLDGQSVPERSLAWRAIITGKPHRAWVVEHEARVAGFAAAGPSRDPDSPPGTAELAALYVDPPLVGTGLGRHLIGHVVEDLCDQGFHRATLWVLAANERARGFYERAGWAPDGTGKSEPVAGRPLDQVRYARALRPASGPGAAAGNPHRDRQSP
jgi:GNAT superfamily N-acetyltransferase